MAEVLFRAKLQRQDLSVPWGFRLQGGSDYNKPLTLLKVTEGSIACKSGLTAGDIVVKLAGGSAEGLTHKGAQEVIVQAGNSLEIIVERAEATIVSSASCPTPADVTPAAHISVDGHQTPTTSQGQSTKTQVENRTCPSHTCVQSSFVPSTGYGGTLPCSPVTMVTASTPTGGSIMTALVSQTTPDIPSAERPVACSSIDSRHEAETSRDDVTSGSEKENQTSDSELSSLDHTVAAVVTPVVKEEKLLITGSETRKSRSPQPRSERQEVASENEFISPLPAAGLKVPWRKPRDNTEKRPEIGENRTKHLLNDQIMLPNTDTIKTNEVKNSETVSTAAKQGQMSQTNTNDVEVLTSGVQALGMSQGMEAGKQEPNTVASSSAGATHTAFPDAQSPLHDVQNVGSSVQKLVPQTGASAPGEGGKIDKRSTECEAMSIQDYLRKDQSSDPAVNAVKDARAVIGMAVAAARVQAKHQMGSSLGQAPAVWDTEVVAPRSQDACHSQLLYAEQVEPLTLDTPRINAQMESGPLQEVQGDVLEVKLSSSEPRRMSTESTNVTQVSSMYVGKHKPSYSLPFSKTTSTAAPQAEERMQQGSMFGSSVESGVPVGMSDQYYLSSDVHGNSSAGGMAIPMSHVTQGNSDITTATEYSDLASAQASAYNMMEQIEQMSAHQLGGESTMDYMDIPMPTVKEMVQDLNRRLELIAAQQPQLTKPVTAQELGLSYLDRLKKSETTFGNNISDSEKEIFINSPPNLAVDCAREMKARKKLDSVHQRLFGSNSSASGTLQKIYDIRSPLSTPPSRRKTFNVNTDSPPQTRRVHFADPLEHSIIIEPRQNRSRTRSRENVNDTSSGKTFGRNNRKLASRRERSRSLSPVKTISNVPSAISISIRTQPTPVVSSPYGPAFQTKDVSEPPKLTYSFSQNKAGGPLSVTCSYPRCYEDIIQVRTGMKMPDVDMIGQSTKSQTQVQHITSAGKTRMTPQLAARPLSPLHMNLDSSGSLAAQASGFSSMAGGNIMGESHPNMRRGSRSVAGGTTMSTTTSWGLAGAVTYTTNSPWSISAGATVTTSSPRSTGGGTTLKTGSPRSMESEPVAATRGALSTAGGVTVTTSSPRGMAVRASLAAAAPRNIARGVIPEMSTARNLSGGFIAGNVYSASLPSSPALSPNSELTGMGYQRGMNIPQAYSSMPSQRTEPYAAGIDAVYLQGLDNSYSQDMDMPYARGGSGSSASLPYQRRLSQQEGLPSPGGVSTYQPSPMCELPGSRLTNPAGGQSRSFRILEGKLSSGGKASMENVDSTLVPARFPQVLQPVASARPFSPQLSPSAELSGQQGNQAMSDKRGPVEVVPNLGGVPGLFALFDSKADVEQSETYKLVQEMEQRSRSGGGQRGPR